MKLYFGSKGGIYYNKRGEKNYLNHDQKRLLFGTITPKPPPKNKPRRGTYHTRLARIVEGRDNRSTKLRKNIQDRRGLPPLKIDMNLIKKNMTDPNPGFTPKSTTSNSSTELTLSSPRFIIKINENNITKYVQESLLLVQYLREFYLKIIQMGFIKNYKAITVDDIVRAFIIIDDVYDELILPQQIDVEFDNIFKGVIFEDEEQKENTKLLLLYILDELYHFRKVKYINDYINQLKVLYLNSGVLF